jgi:Bacteriocin-protection, YdeI or OmpD-Associated
MDITPLARNEFICWVEDAKQGSTRERRIRRTQEELEEGQRRPCCWPGCRHRAHRQIVIEQGPSRRICSRDAAPSVDWDAELVDGDLGTAVQQRKQELGNGLVVGGDAV